MTKFYGKKFSDILQSLDFIFITIYIFWKKHPLIKMTWTENPSKPISMKIFLHNLITEKYSVN
jgi:hypothetical protein